MSFLVITERTEKDYEYGGWADTYSTYVEEQIFSTPEEVLEYLRAVELFNRGKKILTKGPNAGKEADMTWRDAQRLSRYDVEIRSIYQFSAEITKNDLLEMANDDNGKV